MKNESCSRFVEFTKAAAGTALGTESNKAEFGKLDVTRRPKEVHHL